MSEVPVGQQRLRAREQLAGAREYQSVVRSGVGAPDDRPPLAPGGLARGLDEKVLDVQRPAERLELERAERRQHSPLHARFLSGLPECGLLPRFAGLDVAFRKNPMPRIFLRLNEKELRLGAIEPHDDGAGLLDSHGRQRFTQNSQNTQSGFLCGLRAFCVDRLVRSYYCGGCFFASER
jgi:hypothetical protein